MTETFFDIVLRIGIIVALTGATYVLTRWIVWRFALPVLRRARPAWAVPIERSHLPMLTSLLVAASMLWWSAGLLADDYPQLAGAVRLLDSAIAIAVVTLMLVIGMSVAHTIYEQLPLAKDVPLKGFVQLMQGSLLLIGALMILATFLGVPAIYSLTALAALFAALGFVFQDPIMGFVAGIQLAANKMVAIGDWIEVPKHGANGIVREILMSSVKVQNFDNSVTMLPTRSLISDSFTNWRTMSAMGARRLLQRVYIDINTIRPVTPDLLQEFPRLAHLWQQIGAGEMPSADILIEDAAGQPTNLGLYRVYLTDYLCHHPRIHQETTHTVRQLQMEEIGLPLEITVFLIHTGMPLYGTAASSIFEHIYATLPLFGLRAYQRPSSTEFNSPLQPPAASVTIRPR